MLSIQEKKEFLKNSLFKTLPDEILELIASRMGVAYHEDSDIIFLEGEPGENAYIIASGAIEIIYKNNIIETLPKGNIFGEMAVFGTGIRSATCKAKGATTLLFLNEHALKILIQQHPDISFSIISALVDRLERSNRKTVSPEKSSEK
jgi:CRP/FNR family transcriptional regulator